MADKMKSFEDFRALTVDLMDINERARDLYTKINDLWVQADFDAVLASNAEGIDSTVFFSAVNSIPAINTAIDAKYPNLRPLQP